MKQDLEKKGHRGCETSRESYLKQVEIIQFKREVKVSHLDSGFVTERREIKLRESVGINLNYRSIAKIKHKLK